MRDGVQLIAGGASELGVQVQYLDCECDLVDDTLARPVPAGEQLQIWQIVICAVAVAMMYCLFWVKLASKVFGHHISMFEYSVLFAGHKGRYRNPNVAVALDMTPEVSRFEFGKRSFFYEFMTALWRAVFLLAVQTAACFPALRARFTTVRARESVALLTVFSTSDRGAFARAVQWVSVMFFAIFGQVRLHHAKRLLAFFAGETNNLFARGRYRFVEAKSASALQATKTLVGAGVAEKRLSTVFTRLLDRHGHSPVLGSTGIMIMSLGIVK